MRSFQIEMTFMEFGNNDIIERGADWEFSLGFINCRQMDI